MKKHMITAALVAVMALGLGTVAGCSQEAPREDVNANVPAGAPPLMPTSHDGRFENLGAAGCYGCHGANDQANPMLADATALPADHYAGGDAGSLEMDPTHEQCITCHAQAYEIRAYPADGASRVRPPSSPRPLLPRGRALGG